MRYRSTADSQHMTRSALAPELLATRRRRQLEIPGRGEGALASRQTFSGFGALTSLGPPVGAGAGAGAAIGASQGASIGSAIVPGIGTAIGALVGAIGGAIAGSLNKRDPEQANFDQAVALWQQNPDNIYAIGNKYLPLAGLMDLNLHGTPHIPIFIRYNNHGGLGEQKFVNDLTALVYNAAQAGHIGPNDTPLTVMANIVQPWIDSWGYGPMIDPHADMINRLIIGLIMDYVLGRQGSWRARSGDYPFANIPNFVLPTPVQNQPTVSATPSPQPATQTVVPVTPVPPMTSAGGVSTAPPAIGTSISYLRDNATGQMVAIPPGGTFAGILPGGGGTLAAGGWLVSYPAGTSNPGIYFSNNSVLTPYNTPLAATPASTTSSGSGGAMMTAGGGGGYYPPTAGGGGGYYPQDTSGAGASGSTVTPPIAPAPQTDNTMLYIGLAALGVLFLARK